MAARSKVTGATFFTHQALLFGEHSCRNGCLASLDQYKAEPLGDLMTAALDVERNAKLMQSSVALALSLGISPAELITGHDELDASMLA